MWPLLLLLAPSLLLAASSKKCVNGTLTDNNRCVCDFFNTGSRCERYMYCDTLERKFNGGCSVCLPGWSGNHCDKIECGPNGEPNSDQTRCECTEPHSGTHCDELIPKRVLHFYNVKASSIGPIGIIFVIPMILIVYFCNKDSDRRWTKRLTKHVGESTFHKDMDKKTVQRLLVAKELK